MPGIGSVLLAFVDTKPCLSRYLSDPLDLHYSPDCSSADRYRREIFTFSDDRPVPAESSATASRSEEHTSELQSRLHLVCRLLLEKKKKNKTTISYNIL